ncbi:MAG TPA: carboxypeptidase-like regulatory domain-containing protein [Planctomycetota bacterium]
MTTTSDPKAAQVAPQAPVVLVVGRLVEPGGFAPIPALLHTTHIVPIGAGLKPVVPGDDGGFSFYWPSPGQTVAFEVRTAFLAILGSRAVIEEAAKRRVDLPAAAGGATLDAGAVPLPASEKLSWVEGGVQSATGAPLEGLAIEMVGREEFDGLRLRAVDRAATFGHAPNVPARYASDARFLLRHVRPGRYDLSVSARGHRRKRLELEFPTSVPLAPLTLTLDPCVRAVAGRVVDAKTGTPLAGAKVGLIDGAQTIGEATSDAAGAFKAWLEEDPAAPELRLAVWVDGYEKSVEAVLAGEHREIALSRER